MSSPTKNEFEKPEEKKENLWNKILSESRASENRKNDATLIVVGEQKAGKRALIASLEKVSGERLILESGNDRSMVNIMKDKSLSSMIDYFYFTIKNPDDENMELGKINTFFVNEKTDIKMLELVLKKDSLTNFGVLVVLDFEKYHNLADAVPKWMSFVTDKIAPIFKILDLEESDKNKEKMVDIVKNYHEPHLTEEKEILNRRSDIFPESADSLVLPTGCLSPNYGFPIIFAINKADHIIEINKADNSDEILEMIQYQLRKDLVNVTSPIVYTSTKMNINIQVLWDYLKHLFFKMPFSHPSRLTKDSLFVPIGLDNPESLESCFETNTIKDKVFDAVISKPEEKKTKTENEIIVKNHQEFLKKMKTKLKKNIESNGGGNTARSTAKTGLDSSRGTRRARGGFGAARTKNLLLLLEDD